MSKSHYYFSTHTTNPSIYKRLEAFKESKNLSEEGLEMLDLLLEEYQKRDKNFSVKDFCSDFIMKYEEELYEHVVLDRLDLNEFLLNFIGYSKKWNASTRSFGENSKLLADKITEKDLIDEMVNPNKSLKKLLDASGEDLSAVKPFLPALMISLKTNTRDKSKMQFKHTGEFCFDFDKFKDNEEAIFWMEKVFEGTENIKPYLSFISPRGKGFKLFC